MVMKRSKRTPTKPEHRAAVRFADDLGVAGELIGSPAELD